MKLEILETFVFEGEDTVAVEVPAAAVLGFVNVCSPCVFHNKEACTTATCCGDRRSDDKEVIFMRANDVAKARLLGELPWRLRS